MGLREFLFGNENIEYKRDVPENIRQEIHQMLDKILDTEDDTDSCCLNIKLIRKLDSVRELYPIENIKRSDNDR